MVWNSTIWDTTVLYCAATSGGAERGRGGGFIRRAQEPSQTQTLSVGFSKSRRAILLREKREEKQSATWPHLPIQPLSPPSPSPHPAPLPTQPISLSHTTSISLYRSASLFTLSSNLSIVLPPSISHRHKIGRASCRERVSSPV